MQNDFCKYKIQSFSIVLCVILVFFAGNLFSQKNAAARYEINAKRIGVNPEDKDALPRSREFLRLDSTYYVGWFFEGMYKYSRSADYLGYKYAVAPLEKALDLMEKDFESNMMRVYTSIPYYQQNMQLFDDFHRLCFSLSRCYNNLEMPEKTMALLDRIDRYKLQKDFLSTLSDRAWIYHRNRFYTSEKLPFLKNSIEENEKMAFHYCYLQIERIKEKEPINDQWYGYGQSYQDLLTVYHYLALLHNYNQNYDSSEYYYKKLIEGNRISWGNYGNMKHETGNFDEAIFYYNKHEYAGAFALSEPDYYLPMLLVYGAQTKEAINISRERIAASGSTPGFGWYTIGLARSYLYDGQLDSCEFFLDKAFNFKEVHINTTLTQSQYEFTINLLRVQLLDKKIQRIKFYNPGWWYSFTDLFSMLSLQLEKLLLEYALTNALAYNPERKRIMYDLFCAESTFTYDETLYLLKNFSLPYFIEKYSTYHTQDKRERVYRYFDLFVAKFKYEDGEKEEAVSICKQLIAQASSLKEQNEKNAFEYSHERLFLARLYEMLSSYHEGEKENQEYQNAFYEEFAQLVPYSGVRMRMNIQFEGEQDEVISNVINDLKKCNIELTTDLNVPQATIFFSKKGKSYQAVINVTSSRDKQIVLNQQLIFKKEPGVGRELALRLFAKGGAVSFEEEPPATASPSVAKVK